VFHTRCVESKDIAEKCRTEIPVTTVGADNHRVDCHLASMGDSA
jgi:hypothetical protein